MNIPFLDLRSSVKEIREQLDAAYSRVMDSGIFILGRELENFEQEFARFCGARECVGVGSGLDALRLMLLAVGVGPGDEVIVPSNTYIATWLAVSTVGGRLVPVEPNPETFNIDPAGVDAAITSKTRAILPVHLYGQCADMAALARIAHRHGVPLVADAAQAVGARFGGENCGALGHAAAFSFYPTKNLGALSDGGAVVTNDDVMAQKIRMLRNYGKAENGHHQLKGLNTRLGELQAAFLCSKLPKLREWNERRQVLAERYLMRLEGHQSIRLPKVLAGAEPVWHLYTILVGEGRRDALRSALEMKGIGTGIYYPQPPHLTPAFAAERLKFGKLSIAEELSTTILNLPLHPHLTVDEVDYICACISEEREGIQ